MLLHWGKTKHRISNKIATFLIKIWFFAFLPCNQSYLLQSTQMGLFSFDYARAKMLLNVIQDLILAHTEGKEHFSLLLMCFHVFFFFSWMWNKAASWMGATTQMSSLENDRSEHQCSRDSGAGETDCSSSQMFSVQSKFRRLDSCSPDWNSECLFFFYCVMWWTYFKDHLHWCTYCMSEDVFNPPSQYAIMSTVQLGFKTCPTVHDLRAPRTHLYADVKLIFVFHLPSNFRIYRNITSRFWTPMSATQSCVQRHDKACLEEDERHIIKTIPAF